MQALSLIKRNLFYALTLPEEYKCRKLANYNIAGRYKRIYLFHIRKAGGTSINHVFLSLGGEEPSRIYKRISRAPNFRTVSSDKIFVGWNKGLIEKGHYYYAFSHIPKHQLRLPSQTFTVTCLRDPVNRVVSHYKVLMEFKVKNISHPESRWLGGSFSDFLINITKEKLLNQLYMFSRKFNIEEAFDNITTCEHVFFTEEFSRGISELSSKIGINLEPMHTRKSPTSINITEADGDRLRSQLQPEYILIDKLKKYLSRSYK